MEGAWMTVFKTRQQAQNGVVYANPHVTKLRITGLALPGMES